MSLQGYQYVVLRCVPRVEREEFVNVGVVLYSQAADFLEARYDVDEERLRALAPGLDAHLVHDALETLCRVCRGETGGACPTSAAWADASAGSALRAARSSSPGRSTAASRATPVGARGPRPTAGWTA